MTVRQYLKKALIRYLLACSILFLGTQPCFAALPTAVQNTPLPSLSPVLKKVLPCIVSISGSKRIQALAPSEQTGASTPQLEEYTSTSIGSGVIVNQQNGYILTNAHVVSNLDDLEVTLSDQRKYPAKLLGQDAASDLALLQIDAQQLIEAKFADSDHVQVGDFVIAIGNPYGFNQTVTSGIVSAMGRNNIGLDGYYDFIQTDAAINMGNSGGGLFNLSGELIGINTAIVTSPNTGGGSIGLGFAIPTDVARGILTQLAHHGHVDRGPLGVRVQMLTPELAQAFSIPTGIHGAIINEIVPNSAAHVAGIEPGDIVFKVDNKNVKDSIHLRNLISLVPPGNTTTLHVYRNGKKLSLPVTITNPKAEHIAGETLFAGLQGATLAPTDIENDLIPGVRIADIQKGSLSSYSDLLPGDIIVSIHGEQIPTPDIKTLTQQINPKAGVILLQVVRDKLAYFTAVKNTAKP